MYTFVYDIRNFYPICSHNLDKRSDRPVSYKLTEHSGSPFRKGRSRLHYLSRLRFFNILYTLYQTVLTSALFLEHNTIRQVAEAGMLSKPDLVINNEQFTYFTPWSCFDRAPWVTGWSLQSAGLNALGSLFRQLPSDFLIRSDYFHRMHILLYGVFSLSIHPSLDQFSSEKPAPVGESWACLSIQTHWDLLFSVNIPHM